MSCPDLDDLERLARGLDDASRRAEADAHVASCATCRARLSDIAENLRIVGPLRSAVCASNAAREGRPGAGARPTAPAPPRPERIGSFRIERELGRGGMGVVYLAEQRHPRRRVALKVIRPGVASEAMLRRFEHEANVLAQLSHPGIAQIFEAGVTDAVAPGGAVERQPYFAMEFIDGERIDAYAERRGLHDAARLALLARVCDAVHHAHLKGVVHRDLKPGNILVVDGEASGADAPRAGPAEPSGQPKILDFGVARLAHAEGEAASLDSRAGGLVGTVPFMSPEQVAGDPARVDARSDVYALGVIGFALLSGRLPHPIETTTSLPEAARIIRDEEPRRLADVARRFRGDVDTIVAKALARERERRYQSASELALDIRRHLHGEPILARTPSARYQLEKLVARNKAPAALAGALALAIVAFAAAVTLLFAKARHAERAAVAAREAAALEAETANRVSEFLAGLFNEATPYAGRGGDVTVAEVLERGAERALDDLADQPELQSRLLRTIGNAYADLAQYDRARPLLERALAVRRAALGPDDRAVVEALNDLAALEEMVGDVARQEAILGDVLARRGAALAPDDPEIARALFGLAQVRRLRGDAAAAESLAADALGIFRAHFGAERSETALALAQIARLLADRGELDSATAYHAEALEIRRRVLPPDSPWLAESLNDLAVLQERRQRFADAEALLREALALQRKRLGAEHPHLAIPLSNLAGVLFRMNRADEAEALYREALAIQRAALPARHPDIGWRLHNLAVVLEAKGERDEAETLLREALAIRERALPAGHWHTAETRSVLGQTLAGLGRFGEAEPLLLSAHRDLEAARGAADRLTLRTLDRVAEMYAASGRAGAAAEVRERAARSAGAGASGDTPGR
jgi:serine/threonine protein kinase